MFVCICRLDLFLTGQPNSLKGKRQVIKRLKDRVWNKFRVSIAEVGRNGLWQRAEIGISFVANDRTLAEKVHSQVRGMIEANGDVEILDEFLEIEKI